MCILAFPTGIFVTLTSHLKKDLELLNFDSIEHECQLSNIKSS